MTYDALIKTKAISLRKGGKTYNEINKALDTFIPKSTISYWFKNITLSKKQKERIDGNISKNIKLAQKKALLVNKKNRQNYLLSIHNRVKHLDATLLNRDVAKIALAMLYLGEGSKTNRGSLMFGNSDPEIIKLFLRFLRECYILDESKFRCTVQCRADQNVKKLEKFWSNSTKVPLRLFYKAQVDSRTIGKASKKVNYKGVCRIDYFSADIFNELIEVSRVICKM
ncbi:hypothetical protein A2524_04310 [Candidatus Wolfebacteria bacterium RIFOXYD12_FULL_48_21]|nr:MAG: hypothetical protein A2524_04310 [Candidatus Wolfebacteria bacterium RIFOXYD12_FULL_48_21]OGM95783.1 MAG: hypothetical protein A2532_00160 [Candidatus Wolfebacteria bacterium RIFOXYD2_FULL_48_11]